MLKKTLIGVLLAAFLSTLLTGLVNLNVTKAVDYGISSTPVGGYVSEDTAWTLDGSPYIVLENVIVESNVTLTIEQGTVIKFVENTSLVVDGSLIAEGNSTQKITFTSAALTPAIGDWDSIEVRDTGKISNIRYWVVEYAKRPFFHSGEQESFIIQNSLFRWNLFGIDLYGKSEILIENTTWLNNGLTPATSVGVTAITAVSDGRVLVKDSLFSKNEGTYLLMGVNLGNCTILENKLEGCLIDGGEIYNSFIANNEAMGLISGVERMNNTLVFNNTAIGIGYGFEAFDVEYLWNCNIAQNNLSVFIVFDMWNCSLSHNSIHQLMVRDLRDCDVSYNSNATTESRIILGNAIGCSFTHNGLSINLDGGNIASSLLLHNDGGIFIVGSNTSIHYCHIYNNTPYDVCNKYDGGNPSDVNATFNWWGTTSEAIIKEKIYDYYDDYNLGKVIYKPYLVPPMTDFTYSPDSPYAYGIITFDASASFNPYGSIANYIWNFGDGNTTTTTSPVITYVYTIPNSYNVALTVTDEFGLKNSTVTSLTVLEDKVLPVTADDYAREWRNVDFTLMLTVTDYESGVAGTYYRINDGPVIAVSTDGQPLITTEGANNTLEYWSVDNAGNEELPHKILTGIKLDKTSPTGSLTINSNAPYTNSTSVTLTLTATDVTSGAYQVRFSNDGVWDTEPWETSLQTKTWTLTFGDGTKTVFYQIKDNAELVSITYSDTIVLDTTPPTGSIAINNCDAYTNSTSVTLTLTATDATSDIAEMCFSNDNITYTDWQVYTASKLWNLQDADGAKTVYVQFRDHAGLFSPAYLDTIVLDATTPNIGIPSREPTDDIFPAQPVKISINVTDATSQVKSATLYYSLNNRTTWEEPIPLNLNASTGLYEATIPPQLAETWVRFKIAAHDYAGNNATLDRTEPYCVYQVIPEFLSSPILPLLIIATSIAMILMKKKRKMLT